MHFAEKYKTIIEQKSRTKLYTKTFKYMVTHSNTQKRRDWGLNVDKDVIVTVRFDKETYNKVKAIAKVYGVPISTVVRMLVKVGLGSPEVTQVCQKMTT